MNQTTTQNHILPKSLQETLFFLINSNQNLLKLPKIFTFPKVNNSNNIEENKNSKFVTKKRGRKNKTQEEKNDEKNQEINVHDKFSNDNIKRRIKGLFNNYIITLLNNLMKKHFRKSKIKFFKMNIQITKDISIEFNRSLLEKPIKDIIINVSKKYQDLNRNKNCIKFIQEQNDNKEIMNILNMSYKDLYTNYYLKSTDSENSYEAHKEKLLETHGKEYLDKFIENSEGFIEFFTKGKNRKARKQKEKIEVINIPLENEGIETANTYNEANSDDNFENYFLNKNMVSASTQTDISDINSKIIVFE